MLPRSTTISEPKCWLKCWHFVARACHFYKQTGLGERIHIFIKLLLENCWSLEPIKHSWSCLSYPSCSSHWFYAKICNNTWGSSVQAISTHRLRWHFCPFKALHSWVWKLFYFPLCCPVKYLEFQLAYTWTRPATPISAWQALEWSTIPKMMGILGPQSESYVTVFSGHLLVTCRPVTCTKT